MKRLHIHVRTNDLEASIAYYNALFGAEPTRLEIDYAKWLLDDPAVNLAVSSRGGKAGIDHLGVSVDDDDTLEDIAARLGDIAAPAAPEEDTTCCYARSNKYWSHDPQGAVWELFHTFGDSKTYGAAPKLGMAAPEKPGACCGG